ncbi:MAG: hypothetical protein P4L90_04520 [Rhodopila sp.]|nr:hypothetical protein [Rhodopila sp.]
MGSAVAIAALLAAAPGRAFDAAGADIIGLRLGMPETEVAARLTRQGYLVTGESGTIMARTRDGRLQVSLSGDRGVTRINYVFYGRDAGAPAKIQEAVITRFGDPDQAKPMTWCRAVGPDGTCPRDRASLTFLPDSLTLVLQAGAAGLP